jgi:hypothetical protein
VAHALKVLPSRSAAAMQASRTAFVAVITRRSVLLVGVSVLFRPDTLVKLGQLIRHVNTTCTVKVRTCYMRTMPKSGPAYPVDDEWREALAIRLRELGWTHDDLAKRVSEIRGEPIVRSAISHLVKRGIQSTLVPDIEKAIGWDSGRRGRSTRFAHGTASGSRDGQVSIGVMRDLFASQDLLDLLTNFLKLNPANRALVVERVRALLDVQQIGSPKAPK